jgi:putative PIN family toxin of toxin-antitoxin system
MPPTSALKIVIDTNVLFEGLTQQGGAPSLVIDAWLADLFTVCVSNALAYEYVDVLSRKLSVKRWGKLRPVLGALLTKSRFITVYYSWRPISPDKADEHIIDCSISAGATVVTLNVKHFQKAKESLGLVVMTPADLIAALADQ